MNHLFTLKLRARAILSTCAAIFLMSCAVAQTPETNIKKLFEEKLPSYKVDGITKTSYLGLYEVRSGTEVLYVDEKNQYIFEGSIIETKNFKNVTEERTASLQAAEAKSIFTAEMQKSAIKMVRGNGKRTLVVFADPNCGYCKRFEQGIEGLKDVTIYVYLYPVLGPNSIEKSKVVWCSPNREKQWSDLMIKGVPPVGKGECENPIDKIVALGQKLKISGTPTIFFTNGKRVPGAIPGEQVEQLLAQVDAK